MVYLDFYMICPKKSFLDEKIFSGRQKGFYVVFWLFMLQTQSFDYQFGFNKLE